MAVSSAANSGTFKVTTPSDREIRMTRLFDAPRHLVFEAMTKPEHIKRWWGSLNDGYSVPVCEVDLRAGGEWRFVNRHPKGEAGVLRRVSRDHAARAHGLHGDLRAVPRRRIGGDGGPHRGERQDAAHGDCVYPSMEVRDMVIKTRHGEGRRHQLRPARRCREGTPATTIVWASGFRTSRLGLEAFGLSVCEP